MAEAARRMAAQGATLIDINMGCPVRKVVKSGGGSALMCEADAAARLVEAIVSAVGIPVTVKMRLGWDDENLSSPSLARDFENAGASAVILHGRTREQGFHGSVCREGIRATVDAVRSMPIIGNGDVRTIQDADTMFRETGCAAVSIGRGSLANPFLFRQLSNWASTGDPGPEPTFSERVDVMERHFHRLVEHRGPRTSCLEFRKLIKWYNHAIRPPKSLYHRLINLSSVEQFDETLAMIRDHGPISALPSHFEPRVPVPSGPIDKW
jgi:nifR3 family TIM-barrel protein